MSKPSEIIDGLTAEQRSLLAQFAASQTSIVSQAAEAKMFMLDEMRSLTEQEYFNVLFNSTYKALSSFYYQGMSASDALQLLKLNAKLEECLELKKKLQEKNLEFERDLKVLNHCIWSILYIRDVIPSMILNIDLVRRMHG